MTARDRGRPKRGHGSRRRGLTLLEVLLSIAILGAAIATIGELIRVGSRSAARARDLTQAHMLAETKMAEITTGVVPLSPITQTTFEYDPDWVYTIEVQPVDNEGIQAVLLTVEKNVAPESRPTSYQLIRWIREADLEFEEEVPEEESSGESTSGGAAAGGASAGGGSG